MTALERLQAWLDARPLVAEDVPAVDNAVAVGAPSAGHNGRIAILSCKAEYPGTVGVSLMELGPLGFAGVNAVAPTLIGAIGEVLTKAKGMRSPETLEVPQ